MAIQINSLSYGNIKYKYGNSIVDVKEIWYKNPYGYTGLIWPNQYWAGDIQIEDLTSGLTINYSVSTNGDPIYTSGGQTLSGLIPEHEYAITGTIKRGDGSETGDIPGCYFQYFYSPSGSSCWNTSQARTARNKITGENNTYGVYIADDSLTDNLDEEIVVGYHIPTTNGNNVVLLGFGHYSSNFQNATPIILRRIALSEAHLLTASLNSNTSIGSTETIALGSSLTVYPKVRKFGTNYEAYSIYNITISDVTYDSSKLTIVRNQDGSFTITPLTDDISENIDFDDIELNISVPGEHRYLVYYGNNNLAGTISSLTQSRTFYINESDYDSSVGTYTNEHNYTGTYSMTSSDTSIVSVSGLTINPVSAGTVTIVIKIPDANGRIINSFNVTVPQTNTVYYKAGVPTLTNGHISSINGSVTQLNDTGSNIINWTYNSQNPEFAIQFAANQQMGQPVSVSLKNGIDDVNGSDEVYWNYEGTNSSSTDIILLQDITNWTAGNTGITTFEVWDYNETTKLGDITLNIS